MKNLVRVITGAAFAAALVVGGAVAPSVADSAVDPTPSTAQFAENRNLTDDEASARLRAISGKYTVVGQKLSTSDAEFISIYANGGTSPAGSISGDSSAGATGGGVQTYSVVTGTVNRSGSGAGGTGKITGTHTLNNGEFTINNSWSAKYQATGGGTVNKIKVCTHVKAWGAGQGGLVLAYYTDPCATVNGKSNYFSRGTSYTAFVVYSTIQYDAIFYTPTGSFQLAG